MTDCAKQTDPAELKGLALITDAKLSAWRAKSERTADINHCMAAKGWFRMPDHIYSL